MREISHHFSLHISREKAKPRPGNGASDKCQKATHQDPGLKSYSGYGYWITRPCRSLNRTTTVTLSNRMTPCQASDVKSDEIKERIFPKATKPGIQNGRKLGNELQPESHPLVGVICVRPSSRKDKEQPKS